AFTAVDAAEKQADLAFAVNRDGAGNLAAAARTLDARVLHVSTDFVFGGERSRPYLPMDPPSPISVYGRSKHEGELAVSEALGERALLVRTAWLYSSMGANFVFTMLRMLRERRSVSVVADQVGTPTWANGLARALWLM